MSTNDESDVKQPTPKAPGKLKGKTGAGDMTKAEKLELSKTYISAQAASPAGAQIAAEAALLKTAREAVITKDQERADAKALFDQKTLQLAAAEQVHEGAIGDYAYKATKVANGDLSVLTSLGVDAAATKHARYTKGPAGAVTDVHLQEGPTSGSATVKWIRPTGAGAFMAQYKLEPTSPLPSAPPAPTEWMPPECFATKNVEWTIERLPPGAYLRVRVRAIGAEIGPWSDEVLGRAH